MQQDPVISFSKTALLYDNRESSYFPSPKPLGIESKKIPDCSIRASSIWDAYHAASNARLNFRHKSGSW